jgi:hypothetical protein
VRQVRGVSCEHETPVLTTEDLPCKAVSFMLA